MTVASGFCSSAEDSALAMPVVQFGTSTFTSVTLQAGQIDASSAYGTQPDAFKIPYIKLPKEINLGDAALEKEYAKVSVTLDGKTLHPAPLIFYAAVLTGSTHKGAATRFVQWLQGPDAQKIFAANQYDPPGDSTPLTAK